MKRKPISEKMKENLLRCYLLPMQPCKALAVRAAKINLRREGYETPWADSTLRRWLCGYVKAHPAAVAAARG